MDINATDAHLRDVIARDNEVNSSNINHEDINGAANYYNNDSLDLSESDAKFLLDQDSQEQTSIVGNDAVEHEPNYLQQTISSSAPSNSQMVLERISASFRSGSYSSIKKLPSKLKHREVLLAQIDHVGENKLFKSPFYPSSVRSGQFTTHRHLGSAYDLAKIKQQQQADLNKLITDSSCRKPFVIQSRVRNKYLEDIFYDPSYKFPVPEEGGKNVGMESLLRAGTRKLGVNKKNFQTTTAKLGKLRVPPKEAVGTWIKKIFATLVKDWPQYAFKVKRENDELLIQFEEPTEDSTIFPPPNNSLNKYMLQMSKHGLPAEFGLNRRGDRWNIFETVLSSLEATAVSTSNDSILKTEVVDSGIKNDDDNDYSDSLNNSTNVNISSGNLGAETLAVNEIERQALTYSFFLPWNGSAKTLVNSKYNESFRENAKKFARQKKEENKKRMDGNLSTLDMMM